MSISAFTNTLFQPHGGGVRAWCLTGFSGNDPSKMSLLNTVNCYNLNIDNERYNTMNSSIGSSQQGISTGAIPFKFVTPMEDAKYMIFVQPRTVGVGAGGYSEGGVAFFAHALNTPQYPKTRFGFWVRFGRMIKSGDTFTKGILYRPGWGEVLNRREASSTNQLQVVVL